MTVVGCVSGGQETECREVVNCFVVWCGNNHLHLNVAKTKEMVVDFRRTRTKLNTISILGEVEVVEGYRCLGVHLDNRLDWKCNAEVVYAKGQSRFYFLRKVLQCVQQDVAYLFTRLLLQDECSLQLSVGAAATDQVTLKN